jgi:hypothetical protein
MLVKYPGVAVDAGIIEMPCLSQVDIETYTRQSKTGLADLL